MSWLKEVIGTEKAIIAMCHMQAMPGDPGYDKQKGMNWVVDKAREDFLALQEGGVDAVLFSNEFSLPYLTDVRKETVAAMGRVIGEMRSRSPSASTPCGMGPPPWIWRRLPGPSLCGRSLPVFTPVISAFGTPITARWPDTVRPLGRRM